jgi:hypothetical protein
LYFLAQLNSRKTFHWYHVGTELRLRAVILHLILIAIFGVFLPLRKGLGFLEPIMITAYACLGVLFAAPAAANAFSKARPQTMREAGVWTAKAVGYGEGLALVMLIAGVVTVSVANGRAMFPELDVLGLGATLGLAASTALALFAGWMTLRFSGAAARMGLRLIFIGLLVLFVFRGERLPEVPLRGVELSVAMSALMVILLRREVHPK